MDQHTPISEAFVPLRRGTPPDGGMLAAAFCAAAALLWIATCVWLLSLVSASHPSLPGISACLVGIALGVVGLVSQVPHLALALWFRRPRGSVSSEAGSGVGFFTFRYSQRVLKPAAAELTCSLVLRETLQLTAADGEPSPPTHLEHLVDAHRSRGVARHPGDLLRARCAFSLPADLDRRFRLGGGKLSWLVKVRVCLPDQRDFWEEFALPFDPERAPEIEAASSLPEAHRFSVIVLRLPDWFRPERTPEVLLEVAPHLHRVARLPVRALETLSRDEAERACRRLEAAGVSVALYCDDQLVERTALHNLPIPQPDAVTLTVDELPIPTPSALEVAEGGYAAIEPFSRIPEADPVMLRRAG